MTVKNDWKTSSLVHYISDPLRVITDSFPIMLILISIAGLVIILSVFGTISAINSLIYVIPIFLVAVILLFSKRKIETHTLTNFIRLQFSHLALLYALFFLISLVMLNLNSTRTLTYFIVLAVISGILFLQIISQRRPWTDYIIISEIILFSLNLIWGLSLKYPLFFGYTDTLGHLFYTGTVIQTGHIKNLELAYQNFPLFYIYNAMGFEVTSLSLRNALFVFTGIAWQVGILFAFLIFRHFSHSNKLSLIAVLLFASSSEIIFYGAYAITRSLAFVLLLAWFYLILKKTKLAYISLALVMMIALILTHHVTVLFVIPILIILYVCQKIVSKQTYNGIPFLPIALLTVCFFAYLVYVSGNFTGSTFPAWINGILSSGNTSGTPTTTSEQPLSILNLIYNSFALFLSLIGAGIVFKIGRFNNQYLAAVSVALAAIAFLLVYINGPLNLIPQSQSLLAYRFPLLVTPFIVITMAFGVAHLVSLEMKFMRTLNAAVLPILTLLLIISTTFFSIISGPNASDYHYFTYPTVTGDEYFTDSELQSFSFINQNANPSLFVYGDYETVRNQFSLNNLPLRRILAGGDIGYIADGYVVLRTGELARTGGLSFSYIGSNDTYRFYVKSNDLTTDILSRLSTKNRFYSNGDVQIYLINDFLNSP